MCRIPDPPKWKKCRCGHKAVIGDRCGHCYIGFLDKLEKRSRRSTLVIGGPPRRRKQR